MAFSDIVRLDDAIHIARLTMRGPRLKSKAPRLLSTGSAVFAIASGFVGLANLIYHPIVSRSMSTESYGALGALLGLLAIFVVPASALQVVITREVAAHRQRFDVPVHVGPLLGQAVVGGIAASIVLLLFAPTLQSFLHLPSFTSAALLAVYMIPTAIGMVPKAVLLGELRFLRVGFGLIAGALVRLALAGPLTNSNGLEGAMAAAVLGELACTAVLLPSLRNAMKSSEKVKPLTVHWKDGVIAVFAFSAFWALNAVHPFLARHYLPRVDSGIYVAAVTIAQAGLFIPSILVAIAFPGFVQRGGVRSPQARLLLLKFFVAVIALGFGSAAILAVGASVVVGVVYGDSYNQSAEVVGLLAVVGACAGAIFLLIHFFLADRSRLAAVFPWAGVMTATVGTVLFHDSMVQVALVMLITVVLVLVTMTSVAFLRGGNWIKRIDFADRDLWESAEATVDLTMVVPFFNPGILLRNNVEKLLAVLDRSQVSFEVIAVSDGSTDGSDDLVQSLDHPALRLVRLEKNTGKGQALRVGLAMGHGRYLGFIDADGDIDPSLLDQYLALVKAYEPDIVLGSKRHPMSEVHYPLLRRIYSWGYQLLILILFHLNVRDTQTGLKLVRRDVLADVLPRMLEKRFAFDLELFVVSRHLGHRRFFEAPIRIQHQFTSTVSWRSVRGTLLDTLAIFYRLYLLRFYDTPQERDMTGQPIATRSTIESAQEVPTS